MQATTVTLDQLRPGHEYPGANLNSRICGRDAELEQLAASIEFEGLLVPLIAVKNSDGNIYVIDGNRRLAALRLLQKRKSPAAAAPIDVRLEKDSDAAASLRKSLAANMHVPLHPVDRYETFAALHGNNGVGALSEAGIAKRYGITEKQVRQSLSLGRLSPVVRDAWRVGGITAEIAQAFTLADDHADQEKQFGKIALKKGWTWTKPDDVRRLFTGSPGEAKRLLTFVGRAAYEAEGGKVSDDLFGDDIVIHHMAKLKKLAQTTLEVEAERLKGEGWSWVETNTSSRLYSWNYDRKKPKYEYTDKQSARLKAIEKLLRKNEEAQTAWRDEHPSVFGDDEWIRLNQEEQSLSEEKGEIERSGAVFASSQKKTSGCIVSIDAHGRLEITAGLVKRRQTFRDSDADGLEPKQKKEEPALSHESRRALDKWRAEAVGVALRTDRNLALAALLAGFACEGPIGIELPYDAQQEIEISRQKTFAAALAELRDQPRESLLDCLVECVAASVDFANGWDERERNADALTSAVDQGAFAREVAKLWNPKVYFGGASKVHILGVIEEALGEDERRRNETKSQKDLIAFAVASVGKSGWLPESLRAADPSAPAKAKAKAKTANPKRKAA